MAAVLARYLGIAAADVHFTRDACGKPELDVRCGAALRFNISRAGQVGLLAVAEEARVGVDIEPLGRIPARWAIVHAALTERERLALPTDETAAADSFLRSWVRKEALLKAAGVGLSVEPRLVELCGTEIVALPAELGSADSWALVDLTLPRHVAAVAAEGRPPVLRLHGVAPTGGLRVAV
ncbi:MAG: 4'-phosphopantetheinyl transferase superfamily protein [Actinomycetota bacterium]